MTIVGDPFLDEFHDMVERARIHHLAQIEQEARVRLEREVRSRELDRHITQRFSAVASALRELDQGIEYTRRELPEDEGLPVTHTLYWRVTRPHRKLEARVSTRTGRYWFHLVAMEGCGESGAHVLNDSQGDVMDVTADDIDQLIRRLADQQAWQSGSTTAPERGRVDSCFTDDLT